MNQGLAARFARLIAGDGDDAQALPGCAWAVMRGERIVEDGAVGFADPIARRALRADAPMRAASISKVATALTALRLADEGMLSLDSDIADLLGPWARNRAFPEAPIRVRDLLAHTSSMRDGEIYWAPLGARLADFFTPGTPLFEDGAHWDGAQAPGTYYTYCNLAFGVLGSIIERVSGRRFDLVAREKVFAPLGLDCGFNWSGVPAPIVRRAAGLWQRTGGAWAAQMDADSAAIRTPTILNPDNLPLTDYTIGTNGTLFSPQGGLRASVRDLARLGICMMTQGAPVLAPDTFARMRTPAPREGGALEKGFPAVYGLSLQIISPGAGSPIPDQDGVLIGHAGDAYGLRGGLWADVERGFGFVFVFNGGPQDEDRASGVRSAFSRPEEIAMETLHDWARAA